MDLERLDPKERALEKQRSREEDARALALREKTPEELERENGDFELRTFALGLMVPGPSSDPPSIENALAQT